MQQVFPESKTNTGNTRASEFGNIIASSAITSSNDSSNAANNRDSQNDATIDVSQEHQLTKRPTSHHRSNSLNRMQQLLLAEGEAASSLATAATEMDSPGFKSIETCGVGVAECIQDNKDV